MLKTVCVFVVALGVAVSVSAQPRPGAFTTLTTSDTSVTSLCVGADTVTAPSTCLGGAQVGPLVVNQAITVPSFTPGVTTAKLYNVGGTLTWAGSPLAVGGAVGPGTLNFIPVFTGANSIGNSVMSQSGTVVTLAGTLVSTVFGLNSFIGGGNSAQRVLVQNSSAGTAAQGSLDVYSNTVAASLTSLSNSFTTAGPLVQSGTALTADGSGGLSIAATQAAGVIRFYTGGTVVRGSITAAGLFNWTTFGAHTFSAGGTGAQTLTVTNPTAGAGNFARSAVTSDTVLGFLDSYSSTFTTAGASVQAGTRLDGGGTGGLSLSASQAAGAVRIYTGGGTLRATFDAAGNFNLGSTNIMDSPAVPTITSGFCGGAATIAGRDTAFVVTLGTCGGPIDGVVAFNTTYTTAPVCIASTTVADRPISTATTTTSVTINTPVAGLLTGAKIAVLCRGF